MEINCNIFFCDEDYFFTKESTYHEFLVTQGHLKKTENHLQIQI